MSVSADAGSQFENWLNLKDSPISLSTKSCRAKTPLPLRQHHNSVLSIAQQKSFSISAPIYEMAINYLEYTVFRAAGIFIRQQVPARSSSSSIHGVKSQLLFCGSLLLRTHLFATYHLTFKATQVSKEVRVTEKNKTFHILRFNSARNVLFE